MTKEEMDLIRGFVEDIQSLKIAHLNDGLPIDYGVLCTITAKGWELLKELKILDEEPTGWVDIKFHRIRNGGDIETTELMCPYCREFIEWDIKLSHKPYCCPNCGKNMIESQESEE